MKSLRSIIAYTFAAWRITATNQLKITTYPRHNCFPFVVNILIHFALPTLKNIFINHTVHGHLGALWRKFFEAKKGDLNFFQRYIPMILNKYEIFSIESHQFKLEFSVNSQVLRDLIILATKDVADCIFSRYWKLRYRKTGS